MDTQNVATNGPAMNGCFNRDPLKKTVIAQTGWSDIFRDGHGNPHRSPILAELPDPMTKDCQYSVLYGDDPRCAGCNWNRYPHPVGETGMTAESMLHSPPVLLELDPTTHHSEPIETASNQSD